MFGTFVAVSAILKATAKTAANGEIKMMHNAWKSSDVQTERFTLFDRSVDSLAPDASPASFLASMVGLERWLSS